MLINATNVGIGGNAAVSMRCPGCRQIATFEAIENVVDVSLRIVNQNHWLGQRRCPNRECRTHVFIVHDQNIRVIRSYPPERIDFDPKDVPQRISHTLTEALTCHAESCYVAAAIMIRRCLEELCEDKQALGPTLKDRLGAMRAKALLPAELFAALDELRLLGNDAAHLEARLYDTIGQEEVEAALDLTKEILKAVYQLDALVKRLQGLKKS